MAHRSSFCLGNKNSFWLLRSLSHFAFNFSFGILAIESFWVSVKLPRMLMLLTQKHSLKMPVAFVTKLAKYSTGRWFQSVPANLRKCYVLPLVLACDVLKSYNSRHIKLGPHGANPCSHERVNAKKLLPPTELIWALCGMISISAYNTSYPGDKAIWEHPVSHGFLRAIVKRETGAGHGSTILELEEDIILVNAVYGKIDMNHHIPGSKNDDLSHWCITWCRVAFESKAPVAAVKELEGSSSIGWRDHAMPDMQPGAGSSVICFSLSYLEYHHRHLKLFLKGTMGSEVYSEPGREDKKLARVKSINMATKAIEDTWALYFNAGDTEFQISNFDFNGQVQYHRQQQEQQQQQQHNELAAHADLQQSQRDLEMIEIEMQMQIDISKDPE
jgi:hypothetical protein